MNFWQYFQGMALEFEKNGKFFFQISIHFHPCHAKWFRHHYFWVSIDAGTYFGIVK